MACHIISQVCHNKSTLSSFFNSGTLYFQKVEITVDVHFATFVVKNVCCWYQLTVAMVEVKESLQIVYIW